MSQFDLRPADEAQRALITRGLDANERHVLLEHGTEAAFCGVFVDNHKEGIYTCRFADYRFLGRVQNSTPAQGGPARA
jgi:peptide-methionine (R)-S-oxide reductase